MSPQSVGPTPDGTRVWSDPAIHRSGFATANGVRLHYLDWGGSGPALVLIHGWGDNPHVFDDLAPAFTDRFRVVAYARRGHGQSEARGPFDTVTLTEDLHGLMDALGIAKAHLAGWSMGGNETTGMAATNPDRVGRIVYLDAAYDWADPVFATAFKSLPAWVEALVASLPDSAMASIHAYLEFGKTLAHPEIDLDRLEAYLREGVVIQPDGTLRLRVDPNLSQEAFTALTSPINRRDYTKVRAPALAIYPTTRFLDIHGGDVAQTAELAAWDQKYMIPFREASIERVRRELPQVKVMKVPGDHQYFLFTSRKQVVAAMRRFLLAQ